MGRESLNYRRGRGGRPYERAKKRVYANETHCRKCGHPVDMTLPYRDPDTGRINVWSKSYGHTDELDAGGHPYTGGLEHLHCNTSAGATYTNQKRSTTQPNTELITSPDLD